MEKFKINKYGIKHQFVKIYLLREEIFERVVKIISLWLLNFVYVK